MPTIKDSGILLREITRGESNKQLILLTRERGKITAYARGAKNTKSKFAALQPFAYGDFVFYDGGGFLSLNQTDIKITHSNIADNYDKYTHACLFLEIIDGLLLPDMDGREALHILMRCLSALNRGVRPVGQVFAAFVFKFLQKEGLAPLMDDDRAFFAAEGIGEMGIPISKSTIAALQYILEADISGLLHFKASDDVIENLAACARLFLSENVDIKFKSAELIQP